MSDTRAKFQGTLVANDRVKHLIIAAALLHTCVVALYVLPTAWVPQHLFFWSQAYTRPLWHQQWTLFAPDPPLCSAKVLVILNAADHRPIDAAFHHYAMRRMAGSIARYAEQEGAHGALIGSPLLMQAMHTMVRDIGREVPDLHFELMESCVTDPVHPEIRISRTHALSEEATR